MLDAYDPHSYDVWIGLFPDGGLIFVTSLAEPDLASLHFP